MQHNAAYLGRLSKPDSIDVCSDFCSKILPQCRVVRKPVSANPGLKVNRSIHCLCIKMFSIDYVLRSLRFFKLKPEGKTI